MAKPRDGITTKQKLFVREYVKTNGNGQEAAMRVYNAKNENVARNIASTNLTKPNVQEELRRLLARKEYSLHKFTSNLASIASETPPKGYSGADVIKANEVMLKLHGVLTDRKQVTSYNLNVNYSELSEHELKQLRDKKRKETDLILSDDS